MTKRMLIDATHAEETRVVVADNDELLEFDQETSTKKQLKGNIYLAKVTRVEPSLQAAFVDFGGNRHGFLAFNEIHPDYYRIPVEDREALLAEHAEAEDEGDDEEHEGDGEPVEVVGDNAEDDIQELGGAHRRRVRQLTRMYKIQEVIKRRQILLVQVVKEERGNKGAALTTYLSLPGRYCVLMPNTSRGGGISRKIATPAHRKRMKTILSDLEVPDGMAVIMRTAGVERTKAEIRRDYEYLRRLWDDIREQTLQSTAPALIYEEGDVIKRSLRDVYSREIEEVVVDGEDAYKSARTLMKTMMPSHLKRVKKYEDVEVPLYHKYGIEAELDEIHDPVVHLRSGGYIVINQTEALVAVDVNSGRSTRERNVEQTALRTNLEAATEVARQLRLRDLAGLIVIDFIDMDVNRNNSAVERKLKEAMKADRARIQIGRISPLGLLELSRQRLRPSLHEASTQICEVCGGAGFVRSTESTAVRILRAIEAEGIRKRSSEVTVKVPADVALYILNQKREMLFDIEKRHDFRVFIAVDATLVPPDYILERRRIDAPDDELVTEVIDSREAAAAAREEEDRGRRRRRRRSRRRDEGDEAETQATAEDSDESAEAAGEEDGDNEEREDRPRRRRGRRGGRRRRRDGNAADAAGEEAADTADAEDEDRDSAEEAAAEAQEEEAKPKRRRSRRRSSRKADAETPESSDDDDSDSDTGEQAAEAAEDSGEEDKPKRRTRRRRTRKPKAEEAESAAEPTDGSDNDTAEETPLAAEAEAPVESPAEEPAEEPVEEQVAEPAAEQAAPVNGDGENEAADATPAEEDTPPKPAQPRRAGWWNRATT